MAVATADDRKQRFIDLLHELFQLDKPELDFGLYRIMHAKSDQLSRFIREDLAQAIEEAFAEQGEQQLAAMRQEIEEKRRQAEELGAPDPDSAPAVKQARAAYDVAKREQNASADIYDHLYRFFSRYYDKGDFMSRRHHVAENDSRAAPYAVPYDGREVYLHWANKDQYYVKSSETLANFTFNLNEALKKLQGSAAQAGLGFDSVDAALKVHCRVVDATEGEHNDVKESTERFFIIHHDEPARLEGADLVLQFEYRPDPDKTGQSGTWQKKRLEEAEEVIMTALRETDGVAAYRDGLATPAPTDKQRNRTLLGKYLQQYTARNTMDYFIHKDLGGFLSRELDFYIKNEILRLDDIDNADVLIVEQQLKKIQTLRKIAKQIISFLSQLENFQKALWKKKKFVVDVGYCMTLDLLEENEELLEAVFRSDLQRKQWSDVYSLDIGVLESELSRLTASELVKRPAYRYLMLDTSLYSKEVVDEIVSEFGHEVRGEVFYSDNFHALKISEEKYDSSVGFFFIDPPYNTGGGDFIYKDNYKDSSWLSMMRERLSLAMAHADRLGHIWVTLDESEAFSFHHLLSGMVGENNIKTPVSWQHSIQGKGYSGGITPHHNYLFCGSFSEEAKLGVLERQEEHNKAYSNPDNDPRGAWRTGDVRNALYRPNLRYKIKTPSGGEIEPPEKGWRWSKETLDKKIESGEIFFSNDESRIVRKIYLCDQEGRVPESIWFGKEVGTSRSANSELKSMFGYGFDWGTPKPTGLVKRAMEVSQFEVAMDFFAGSGTTGHSAIDFIRKGEKINYLLAEVGDVFWTTLIPRLKKAAYASSWKGGVPDPGALDGVSHCFKYLRLESYDDTLNNLELDDNPQRDALMEQNPELRRDYTLKYLLDVETRGSASLLNTEWFRDPESYTLKVKQPGGDETRETAVDLVETFNWLIGLHVTHLDKPRTYVARFERETDPELPEDQNTRLKAVSLRENEDGAYWIRQVEGHVRRIPGSDEDLAKVLVVWRKLTDDPEKDAAVLEALLEKYKIGTTDSEFDAIYINGPHGLNLTGSARRRVHSLEETFHARMWEGCGDEH